MSRTARKSCALTIMIVILGVLLAGITYSETQEYKEYTVQEGDTLWGIASKEAFDPFLWPEVWKENPGINNPDLIYPGRKIRIPLRFIQKEIPPPPVVRAKPLPEIKPPPPVKKEEPVVKIEPIEKKYLIDRHTLISSGYIADSLESKGQIAGSPTERTVLGKDDFAYIIVTEPVKAGDRFYVIRSAGKVKHPVTGDFMGYLIDVLGVAEAVGKESGGTKVKITASFSEILVGDLLGDYYEVEPPFLVDDRRTPDIPGFIVATRQGKILNGQQDIVHIDAGKKDGVEIGDLFGAVSTGMYNIPNGYMQVINTKETTATAIIRMSEKEVLAGDMTGLFTETRPSK